MFSLHIDSARTWRGGQNQVLLTVLGMRALGHRSTLVAHPAGELRQRAREGLDLIPLAPATEMDLSAAWRLSRLVKQLKPDVIHAHDPHAVAMAALALSMWGGSRSAPSRPPLVASRRVDFHLRQGAMSRWKYRQVDCFIAASEAIRQMLIGDGTPPQRTVTVHEGIDVDHARPQEGADKRALALVSAWNSDARGDQAAPAIFAAWFHELTPALVTDELGSALTETYAGKFSFVARFLARTLAENDARWCDDTRTEKSESCDDTVTAALHSAVTDLARRFGGDMSRWRWDGVHRAIFPHQGLDSVGALRAFISRSVPNGGDWSTVNVGPVAADAPYEQHSVAGYRQIVDLSPANDSRFLNDVGESGHPLSRHYDDFLADWHAVKHRRMRMDRREVESGAIGRLTLKSEK